MIMKDFNTPLSLMLYNSLHMLHFQKIVLSVLLFSFSLTIIHDYAFVDTYSYAKYNEEVYCVDNKTMHISKDEVKSQVHDGFHILMEVSLVHKRESVLVTSDGKPFYIQDNLTSHIQTVLQRPPSIA